MRLQAGGGSAWRPRYPQSSGKSSTETDSLSFATCLLMRILPSSDRRSSPPGWNVANNSRAIRSLAGLQSGGHSAVAYPSSMRCSRIPGGRV